MTDEQALDLSAHVGCGDLDAMWRCDRCDEIRRQLARVRELERERDEANRAVEQITAILNVEREMWALKL